MSSDPSAQPFLHALTTVLRAPMVALCGPDGQLRPDGVQGVYAYDRRVLSAAVVTVEGREPECIGSRLVASSLAESTSVVRGVGDLIPDPTVLVHRRRAAESDAVVDTVQVVSHARVPVSLTLRLRIEADLAEIEVVKQGLPTLALAPAPSGGGVRWVGPGLTSTLSPEPPPDHRQLGDDHAVLTWVIELAPRASATVSWRVSGTHSGTPVPFVAAEGAPWSDVRVRAGDARIDPLVRRGLDDVAALLMRDGSDVFASAGSPWFFTLFGRDALWTARLLLPFGTELALGTLRALARRQGTDDVPATEEQLGKILHEVRRDGLHVGDLTLPPVYYGSVDATPLWLTLLVEAWRWGADPAAVAELVPAAERALDWMRAQTDPSTGGFLRYIDHSGVGLTNQGWKDSGDSVQWADSRLAEPPIALSEVQAYAYEAAVGSADLLEAFGRPGAEALRDWARALKQRFAREFWVEHPDGRFPALALDGSGAAVDAVASNMGHLLGTGLLTSEEAAAVALRVSAADMDSGYGLRTMSATARGFSPMSYHGGAVWPHDTVITARGLLLEGYDDEAARLLEGLVRAAAAFDDRLPELFAGVRAEESEVLAYPAACRPQAWSAAASTCVATLLLGLRPDIPAGTLVLRPSVVQPWGELSVDGLSVGGHRLSGRLRGSTLGVSGAPADWRIVQGDREIAAISGASAP